MLAVFISWVSMSVIFLSFGDFLVFLSNALTKENCKYSTSETYLLGIFSVLIPLSFTSLWLPSNQSVLFAFLGLSFLYWTIRRQYLFECLQKAFAWRKKIKTFHLIFVIISVFCFFLLPIGSGNVGYDNVYYHNTAIRWNEEFAVVPGLANLEERLGFNSNFFLITAIFTFRWIFNDPIVVINSLTAAFIMGWISMETIKSNFETKRIVLWVLFIIITFFYIHNIGQTSTDVLPNIIFFYLAAKAILYPTKLKEKKLLYTFIPILLISIKLSFFFCCIFTLAVLYSLIREKKYRPLIFILAVSFLSIAPWLIRNVIISGYLIYPLYQIDLFSFDWKVPKEIAIKEMNHIFNHAYGNHQEVVWSCFKNFNYRSNHSWHIIFYALIIASTISIGINMIRKRKELFPSFFITATITLFSIIYWIISAPSLRFIFGIVIVQLFLAIYSSMKKGSTINTLKIKIRYVSLLAFSTGFLFFSYRYAYKYKRFVKKTYFTTDSYAWKKMLFKTYSVSDMEALTEDAGFFTEPDHFRPYEINNGIIIYISTEQSGLTFDKIPSMGDNKLNTESIFQSYEDLEARGYNVQDGFRSTFNKKK